MGAEEQASFLACSHSASDVQIAGSWQELVRLTGLIRGHADEETIIEGAVSALCRAVGVSRGALFLRCVERGTFALRSPAFGERLGQDELAAWQIGPSVVSWASFVARSGISPTVGEEASEDEFLSRLRERFGCNFPRCVVLRTNQNVLGFFVGCDDARTTGDTPLVSGVLADSWLLLLANLLDLHLENLSLQKARAAEQVVRHAEEDLLEAVVGMRSLAFIAERLARAAGRLVVVHNPSLQVLAVGDPGTTGRYATDYSVEVVRPLLKKAEALIKLHLNEVNVSKSPGSLTFRDGALCLDHLILAIRAGSKVAGYVSLIRGDVPFQEIDERLLQAGARALGLKMLYDTASTSGEASIRRDFLMNLLSGNFVSEQAVTAKGTYLGYDLTLPFQVAVITWDIESLEQSRELVRVIERLASETLSKYGGQNIQVVMPDGRLVLLCDASMERPASAFAEDVALQVRETYDLDYRIGIGAVAASPKQIQDSYDGALAAISIMEALGEKNSMRHYHELGVYALLRSVESKAELVGFASSVIGKLLEHDREKNSELLHTLNVYLSHRVTHEEVAKRLFIHVNSLKYRLRKIERILGVSLDDPEVCFNLSLAIKALQVAKSWKA